MNSVHGVHARKRVVVVRNGEKEQGKYNLKKEVAHAKETNQNLPNVIIKIVQVNVISPNFAKQLYNFLRIQYFLSCLPNLFMIKFGLDCVCNSFIHPITGIGKCGKPDKLFDQQLTCYVKTPSSCNDLKNNPRYGMNLISAEACQNDAIPAFRKQN